MSSLTENPNLYNPESGRSHYHRILRKADDMLAMGSRHRATISPEASVAPADPDSTTVLDPATVLDYSIIGAVGGQTRVKDEQLRVQLQQLTVMRPVTPFSLGEGRVVDRVVSAYRPNRYLTSYIVLREPSGEGRVYQLPQLPAFLYMSLRGINDPESLMEVESELVLKPLANKLRTGQGIVRKPVTRTYETIFTGLEQIVKSSVAART